MLGEVDFAGGRDKGASRHGVQGDVCMSGPHGRGLGGRGGAGALGSKELGCVARGGVSVEGGGHSIEIGPLNCFPEAESHALRGHDAVKGDQGTGVCVVCILRVPPNVFPLCPWHPEPCPGHGGTRRSVFITVHALSYLIPQ